MGRLVAEAMPTTGVALMVFDLDGVTVGIASSVQPFIVAVTLVDGCIK